MRLPEFDGWRVVELEETVAEGDVWVWCSLRLCPQINKYGEIPCYPECGLPVNNKWLDAKLCDVFGPAAYKGPWILYRRIRAGQQKAVERKPVPYIKSRYAEPLPLP